ncbi:hypothetical protein MJO29_016418 [Puccinia striiformis f. sp. tritici]|nr:hypothetical protein MJO29_016418 [Puccinia striiformis f. sp. tritici]
MSTCYGKSHSARGPSGGKVGSRESNANRGGEYWGNVKQPRPAYGSPGVAQPGPLHGDFPGGMMLSGIGTSRVNPADKAMITRRANGELRVMMMLNIVLVGVLDCWNANNGGEGLF